MAKRDEFTERTAINIARRVNYHCSKPDCGVFTQAPHADPAKVTNLGEAAHITAAAAGGPRYDPALTSVQRKHASNGIWLCRPHARLVDADNSRFTVEELRNWKRIAEERTFNLTVTMARAVVVGQEGVGEINEVLAQLLESAKEDLTKFIQAEAWLEYAINLNLILTGTREQAFDVHGLARSIETFDEIAIVASPGTGKTVTLFQLTNAVIDRGVNVAFYVPLSEWATGPDTIFQSILKRRSFKDITLEHLALLAQHGKLVLVLDGWNELDDSSRKKVRAQIYEVQRDYPGIRIVVSSRFTEFDLPINGPVVEIRALSDEQQLELAKKLRGEEGAALLDQAWRTPGLRELVSIPLYLSVLLRRVAGGKLPTTKEELLGVFAREHEEKPDNADLLRHELQGFHTQYLSAIAAEATTQETTALAEQDARKAVNSLQNELKARGQIALLAQPQKILDILSNAHLLIRSYGETGSISFQHQQFQEWYASFWVEQLVRRSVANDPEAKVRLKQEVLDIPFWEESILFACERLSRENDEGASAVGTIAVEALEIDPLMSAEIIFRSSEAAWEKVKNIAVEFARKWHRAGRVDRAFQFMLNTGRSEFSEKIWPLISHQNQSIHLEALRAGKRFRTSVLGPDTAKRISALSEEVRKHILSEIAGESGIEGIELATNIAKNDPSDEVKISVIEALLFRRAERFASLLLENASDKVWHTLARWGTSYFSHAPHKERIQQEVEKEIQNQSPQQRIESFLREPKQTPETGAKVGQLLKVLDFADGFWVAHRAHEFYPAETQGALLSRLEEGKAIPPQSKDILQNCKQRFDEGPIAERVLEALYKDNRADVEACIIGPNTVQALFARLIELDLQLAQAKGEERQSLYREHVRLSGLASRTGDETFATAILRMPPTRNERQIALLAELIAHHGQGLQKEALELEKKTHKNLTKRLIEWGNVLLESADASRAQMAEIPQAARRLGTAALLPILNQLLLKDAAMRKAAIEQMAEARRKGLRADNDAHVVWSHMYMSAFSAIGGEEAVAFLKPYLSNLEFGADAASALHSIWRASLPRVESKQGLLLPSPDFSDVRSRHATRKAGKEIETHPFVSEILAVVKKLQEDDSPELQRHALRLAAVAFSMPHRDMPDEISALLRIPRPESDKAELLTTLALAGHTLPAKSVIDGLDQLLEEAKEKPWMLRDGDAWRLFRWLKLLPYTDSPRLIIDVLSRVEVHQRVTWRLRELMSSLANSPSAEIEEILFTLAIEDARLLTQYEWLGTLSLRGTIEAARVLLRLLADERLAAAIKEQDIYHVSARLAGLMSVHEEFRSEVYAQYLQLSEGTPKIVVELAISEVANKEGIMLLLRSAAAQNKKWQETSIHKALESCLIGRRESVSWAGTQELFGLPSADLRKSLFEIFRNGSPSESALAAKSLVVIDEIRDRYGYVETDRRHPDIETGVPWPNVV